MSNKTPVLIYRDHLLSFSETFILNQAENLFDFIPHYVGLRTIDGLKLPDERITTVNTGKKSSILAEFAYKVFGYDPFFTSRVRDIKPKLIHAHFGPDGARAIPLARKLNIPLVVTMHGFDATVKDKYFKKNGPRIYLLRRKQLIKYTNLFVAVSNFIKKKMIEKGFPSEKIVVHYIGVNTQVFKPDLKINREPIVLFVGRLVENKGCDYLIRAMNRVQSMNPELELVIIGDGPRRKTLEEMAKNHLKKYRFLGRQSSEIVRLWMNRASIFSVPSITVDSGASEGFGLVFAEAQAMGLPCVSFRTGGIPEAILHGKTGLLAPEKDLTKLSEGISRLWNNPNLRKNFSEAGREMVEKYFNIDNNTKQLENYYNEVLNK